MTTVRRTTLPPARPNRSRRVGAATPAITTGTLMLLAVITSFGALSLDLYLPGLPSLQHDLDATSTQAQLTVTACVAGLAIGQLLCGVLGDMVGRRPVLITGASVWVLATVACSLVTSIPQLIALRVLQGLAAGVGIALSRSVIADRDPAQMVTHLARMFLVLAAVPVAAPTLGALLIDVAGWRRTFVVLGCVGVIYLVGMVFFLEESLPVHRRTARSLDSARHTVQALLTNSAFVRRAVASGLSFGVLFTYIGTSAFIFREGFGLSGLQYGLLFGANAIALITGIQLSAPLTRRNGAGRTQVLAGLAGTAAAIGMAVAAVLHHNLVATVVPLALVLLSTGILMPAASAAAMTSDSTALPGASGVMGAVQFAVGGSASAVGAALVAVPSPLELALASLGCLAAATVLSLPGRRW